MATRKNYGYDRLGRYLLAACMGYRLGIKPETALKQFIRDQKISEDWMELAEMLDKHLAEAWRRYITEMPERCRVQEPKQ